MPEMFEENISEELVSHHLRIGPFKGIFSFPDKTFEENSNRTNSEFGTDNYRHLLSRFIIGDFKTLDKQSNESGSEDKNVIQANRKNLDKLKRKIKRGIAERAHRRTRERREQRIRKSKGRGQSEKRENEGRQNEKGKGRNKRGSGRSPSPSRDGKKSKDSKKGKRGSATKKGGKGGRRSPSPKTKKSKSTERERIRRKDGKRSDKRESRRHYSDDRRNRDRSFSPAVRKSKDIGRRSRRDMSPSNVRRHRRRSGSPPPEIRYDDREEGRYGKRKRKKFRYPKTIMRRIKARYMKEKAKKIFKAKMKRGHVIKYWRRTPKNRDKQRRVNLEREYGKRGAYEILLYEHREMKLRKAQSALKLERKRGLDFHSGEEDAGQDDQSIRRLEDKSIKKPLQISEKIQALLKKSSAHLKIGIKKKKGKKYLQEYPPGFYESVYNINDAIDSSQIKSINKREVILYGPDKEERFVVEDINYEDPWEEPERNRIMKMKEKRIKIRILKDYHRARLGERKKHRINRKEPLPELNQSQFKGDSDQWSNEPDGLKEKLVPKMLDTKEFQDWQRTTEVHTGELIQGSFQRNVNAGWKNKSNIDNYENDNLKTNKYIKSSKKYHVSSVKDWRSQQGTAVGQRAVPDVSEEPECYEDEDEDNNDENSYEESQYSDLDQESGSDASEDSRHSEDGRSVSEDNESDREYQTQYSGTDQGGSEAESYTDTDEESQISEEQGSFDRDYTSYGESDAQHSGSDQGDYTDASYDSE